MSHSKFLWLGSALVFFIFLGIAQFLHVLINAWKGDALESDILLVCGAAAFSAFSAWMIEQE